MFENIENIEGNKDSDKKEIKTPSLKQLKIVSGNCQDTSDIKYPVSLALPSSNTPSNKECTKTITRDQPKGRHYRAHGHFGQEKPKQAEVSNTARPELDVTNTRQLDILEAEQICKSGVEGPGLNIMLNLEKQAEGELMEKQVEAELQCELKQVVKNVEMHVRVEPKLSEQAGGEVDEGLSMNEVNPRKQAEVECKFVSEKCATHQVNLGRQTKSEKEILGAGQGWTKKVEVSY